MRSKPPIIIVLLALLTFALVGPAFAGIIWSGGGNAPAPPTGLIRGSDNSGSAKLTSGIIRKALFTRASYSFPTSYPSPVNRYDWSRWLDWIGGQD